VTGILLPDVNVLIYAHREDTPEHDRYAAWLPCGSRGDEPFAVAEIVLALHDQELRSGRLLQTVDRRDVRMIQRGEHVRLALEARHALGIMAEPVGDDLDRDVAAELRVARAIDLAHAPGANKREDLVGAKACAGGKAHGLGLMA
jgi:hypothetical protein